MAKQSTRQRPTIQANRVYMKREDHPLCQTPKCRNVIATWTGRKFCSRCNPRK